MSVPESGGWRAAEELLADLQGDALAGETSDYLAGHAWVTVWHGEPESPEDTALITSLTNKAHAIEEHWPGCLLLTQGGGDYTAVKFGSTPCGPSAERIAGELAEFTTSIAPGTWWRITPAAPASGPPDRSAP